MPIFRKSSRGPYDLAVSMVGVRMGDRLLQLGCGNGGMFAALAAGVGLTGRACAVDDPAGAERGRVAAERAGVLVEVTVAPFSTLPYDDASFDILVIRDLLPYMRPEERVGLLQEAIRVLRPGGRCLVIEQAPRGGLGSLFARRTLDEAYAASGGPRTSLEAEGFRGIRRLAERDGLVFVEALK